jgi:hypothetical protein
MSPLAQAAAALATRKLRIEWDGIRPEELHDEALLPVVWATLRAVWPAPPGLCEDERVTLRCVERTATGFRVAWEAVFDFDFAGSIDKTETRSGALEIST